MSRIAKAVRGPLRSAVGVPKRRDSGGALSGAFNWQPNMAYSGNVFDTSPQSLSNVDHFTSSDGLHVYALESSGGTNNVIHYELTDAWDISTASFQDELSVSAQDSSMTSGFMSPDGTKMFLTGNNSDTVYQYTLPTPYSMAGASYSGLSFLISGQTTNPQSIFVSGDGLRFYVLGTGIIYQYSMSSAFSINTSLYAGLSLSGLSGADGIFLDPKESKLYLAFASDPVVKQYDLQINSNISSGVDTEAVFYYGSVITGIGTASAGVSFSQDGTRMLLGDNALDIYQFNFVGT